MVGSEVHVEELLFSAGGGFLFGAVAGYAIKKVMRIAALIVGLFVAGLAYLSYTGFVDVKWLQMENATRGTFLSLAGQAVHVFNNTASQFFAAHSAVTTSDLPIPVVFGFIPGLVFGFRKG